MELGIKAMGNLEGYSRAPCKDAKSLVRAQLLVAMNNILGREEV